MVFYGLSRRFFDYNFKINLPTDFIVSVLFFHMPISIAAKFLVYWLSITEDIDPYSYLWNNSEICFILMRNALFW